MEKNLRPLVKPNSSEAVAINKQMNNILSDVDKGSKEGNKVEGSYSDQEWGSMMGAKWEKDYLAKEWVSAEIGMSLVSSRGENFAEHQHQTRPLWPWWIKSKKKITL